jgi:phage terminase small subunit
MPGLTDRQRRFIDEYLVDLNAVQAALRAGYSPSSTGRGYASCLLRQPEIAEAIERALAERAARTHVTQDRVIKELASIAFAKLSDFMSWSDGQIVLKPSSSLTDEQAAAVARVGKRSIKLHDKIAALKLLGMHLGMYSENRNVTLNLSREAEQIAEELGIPVEQVYRETGVDPK